MYNDYVHYINDIKTYNIKQPANVMQSLAWYNNQILFLISPMTHEGLGGNWTQTTQVVSIHV